MLLSEALELFKSDYIALKGLSSDTEENYGLAVLSFTRAVADKKVSAITSSDILEWRRWMEKRNKPGTVRMYMSKLKNILEFTNKKGLTTFDISDIYLPKLPPPLPEFLYPDEVDQLIDAAWLLRDKLIISFLFCSGLRVGELCSLDKPDIMQDMVYVRCGKNKTSRPSFIDTRTRELLELYYQARTDNNRAVFINERNRRMTSDYVTKRIKLIGNTAKLNKSVHAHMLRHSFATQLIRSGVDISYVQKMMGHSFVNTTQIYVHLTGTDLKKAHSSGFSWAVLTNS